MPSPSSPVAGVPRGARREEAKEDALGPSVLKPGARAGHNGVKIDVLPWNDSQSRQTWKGAGPEFGSLHDHIQANLFEDEEEDGDVDDDEIEEEEGEEELEFSDEEEQQTQPPPPPPPQQQWGAPQPRARYKRGEQQLGSRHEDDDVTAASDFDLESAKGLTCERGGEGEASAALVTEERRREAALALQETVDDSMVCEPGRLRFRAIICVPIPIDDPQVVASYRGRKNTTMWVKDARGYEWRLMYFPLGNNTTTSAVSLYLEVNPSNPEYGQYCRRLVHFSLRALNYLDESKSAIMQEDHEFTTKCVDWGFPRFLDHYQLFKVSDGLIYDGKIVVEARLDELSGVTDLSYYDAKRETGMVGLRNQGATCYMNSLLQTLWSLRQLRMAVYDMPTEAENTVTSVALALQRVFFRLQTSDKAVSTKELTKAFGWDVYESFQQQDVQELMRVLCDKLEEKMKDTRVDGTIKNLFEGRFRSFTRCINVEYVSEREESFYDVQLDVKGCGHLSNSFQKYIGVETLTGDNQYDAEGHGKQDAERGMIFMTFPPVLTVHLKRFEFDPRSVTMVKINDRFEFPLRVDLDPYVAQDCRTTTTQPHTLEPGQEPPAVVPGPNVFSLHSILVHSGDVHAGHYYAYIRPSCDPRSTEWFKYDDEVVTRVSQEEALEDSFGAARPPDEAQPNVHGDGGTLLENGVRRSLLATQHATAMGRAKALSSSKSTSSAYMLVYVREADLPQVMRPMTDHDIPEHLRERFLKEVADHEAKQLAVKERAQYAQVEVLTEEDVRSFRKYTPCNDFAPLPQDSKATTSFYPSEDKEPPAPTVALGSFKMRKEDMIAGLLPELSRRAKVPMRRMRLWVLCTRVNKTTRVDQCLSLHNNGGSIDGGDAASLMLPYANHNPAHMMTTPPPPRREKTSFRTKVRELQDEMGSTPRLYLEVLPEEDDDDDGRRARRQQQQQDGGKGEEEGVEGEEGGTAPSRLPFEGPRNNLYAAGQFDEEEGGEEQETDGEGRSPRAAGEEEVEEEEEGMDLEDGPQPLFPSTRHKKRAPPLGPQERRRKLPRSSVAAEEEERLMSSGEGGKSQEEDVLAFLDAFPPPEPRPDHVMLFFKRYAPLDDPSDPLQYKFCRHLRRSMRVSDMVAEIRACDPTLAADVALEAYEEVTPLKVSRLPPEQTLEEAELLTGDIICYQEASLPVDEAQHLYNRPGLPHHVNAYFSYLMLRRRIHFRPYGTRDKARLQACVESIQQRGLEVQDKCWVGVNKDTNVAEELVLEVSAHWSYRQYQDVLAGFLHPAIDQPRKLRFHGCEAAESRPSRLQRALIKASELDSRESSPHHLLLPHVPPSTPRDVPREDVLFFEVLPFAMPDMDTHLVRDVVVNDARLRRAAAPAAAQLIHHKTTPKRAVPTGAAQGEASGPPTSPPLLVVRPAPVAWTMWSTSGEPLVATVLLAREASVGNLVEAVDHLLGLEEPRRAAAPRSCEVRVLLTDAHYRLQQVMRWDQDVDQLPESHLKSIGGPTLFPGRLLDARGKVLYETIEPRELQLLKSARKAKRAHADLLRRRAAAAGSNGGRQGGGVGEEKREAGEDGQQLMEDKAEEDEEEGVEEEQLVKFLPLQVNFASVPHDKGHQQQANGGGVLGDAPPPCGFPLVSYVEPTDTLASLLHRLAPRIGEEAHVLRRQWRPVLCLGGECHEWPGEEEAPPEEAAAMEVDQAAPVAAGGPPTALWAFLEERCSRFVGMGAVDVTSWTDVPSLTFMHSEPVAVEPAWKEVDHRGANKRARGNNAGIKIR